MSEINIDEHRYQNNVKGTYSLLIIKNYIEELYKVRVKSVNTMIYQGKNKRSREGRPSRRRGP